MRLAEKSAGFENGSDFHEAFGFWRDHRQTPDWFEQTHHAHCSFHGDGTGLDEIYVHEREDIYGEVFARLAKFPSLQSLARRDISAGISFEATETMPLSAESGKRKSERVISTENDETLRDEIQDRAHLRNISGGFFHSGDVFNFRKTRYGGGFDVDASAAGNVINNEGISTAVAMER